MTMTTVDQIFSSVTIDAGESDSDATISQPLDQRSLRWVAPLVALVILVAAVV